MGASGVWFPLESDLDPFVWRVKWPEDIVRKLSEYHGISISDVECAGVLLQQMGLESEVADLHHKKAVPFCNNTPAVSWVTRMASKQSQVVGFLAKGIAFRARNDRMCLPEALSISGDANKMADVSSRSFIELHRLLKAYRWEDPPPKPQLATLVIKHLQRKLAANGHSTALAAIADLVTIAFFFLLRVGKYTMPALNRQTCTVQFCIKYVKFYENDLLTPNTSPLGLIAQSNGIAMCISNQKNRT